jgi:uncharacterized protein YkwD
MNETPSRSTSLSTRPSPNASPNASTNASIDVVSPRGRRRAIAVVAAAVLGIVAVGCTADQAATNLGAINALRATVAAPELVRVPELDRKAQAQADRMARRGRISHSTNFTSGVPSGWHTIAENVAVAGSIEQAQQALEASPPHYANLTNPVFNQVGIGVAVRNGAVYVVQFFVGR